MDYMSIVRNFPRNTERYRGFWRIYLAKTFGDYPIKLGFRGSVYNFFLRERDRPVFDEFYFADGYDDLKEVIEGHDVLVDIGAHIGLFSIEFEGFFDEIHSYEANPRTYKLLHRNAELNSLDKLNFYNRAVTKEEVVRLNTGEDSGLDTVSGEERGVEVDMANLEDVLDEIRSGDIFLKMDCEGSEFSIILNSDSSTLERFDTIFLEWHSDRGDPEKLRQKLIDSGFDVKEREDPRDSEGGGKEVGFFLAT